MGRRNVQLVIKCAGYAPPVDPRFCSAFASEKYENNNNKRAAPANANATHSAATLPTDQDNIAARPRINPLGRQTQAIRRVCASTAEARSGLRFVLHHIG